MASRNALSGLTESSTEKPTGWGIGLVALDVILNGSPNTPPKLTAGGSCGNVMAILSYLGWASYPVARLKDNQAASEVIDDLKRWGVKTDFITRDTTGSTQIIIHRILKNKKGKSIHRFEFRNPKTGKWFPSYKPYLSKNVLDTTKQMPDPRLFYFDRINRASIDMAHEAKKKGAVIFFEPSSLGEEKHFIECLEITDILKFSSERIPDYKTKYKKTNIFLEIETQGENGLNFRCSKSQSRKWKLVKPYAISELIDAAGAGDWCTAGIIDATCRQGRAGLKELGIKKITAALEKGQMLGALNCLFDGARGMMYNVDKSAFDSTRNINTNAIQLFDKGVLFKKWNSTYKEYQLKAIEESIFGS